MKGRQEHAKSRLPWYSPENHEKATLAGRLENAARAAKEITHPGSSKMAITLRSLSGLFTLALATLAGVFYFAAWSQSAHLPTQILFAALAGFCFLGSVFLGLRQLGDAARRQNPESDQGGLRAVTGFQALTGTLPEPESRKGMPAPEMVLHQFVQQVKAYATERSYQKSRTQHAQEKKVPGGPEPVDLLKRRWNEVLDSLNEFEIYLSGDQRSQIEKLLSRYPSTPLDVSQIFRDVAENFDTTWRRKGINIESAIVTPLKATTSEPILRRILVGPWRTCAYLARRGNGVVFSAQSQDGKVVARWECTGVTLPESYLEFALDSSRSANERIEAGMKELSQDPQNTNVLFALVSFITWIDLATACESQFELKNSSEGLVITLTLE